MKDVLKQFLLKFNQFNAEEIELIMESTSVETFQKGDMIIQEGKVSKKCYLVIKGCLEQFQTIEGIEKTSGFFLEGSPLILYSSYLPGKPSQYAIQCLENTTLISGTREKERILHPQSPLLQYLTHTIMVEDFKKAEQYIALLNHFNPEQRYGHLLTNQPEILNRVPLVYIASYLGITPESLSRIRKRIGVHKD